MNAKHESSTNRPAVVADDIFVSTLIPARRWIASAVAVVMTSLVLAVVALPSRTVELGSIDGIRVTNLAPVVVTPTAAERKAAALLEQTVVGVAVLPANGAAAQLGAQLAMPYYSFGNTAASTAISKE